MTDYEYDENLPYVVETGGGNVVARFHDLEEAGRYAVPPRRIVDTTPKPRVPDDAEFITWLDTGHSRWFAERTAFGWKADNGTIADSLEDLPGVTPDTVFTVLDERKNDD